MPQGLARTTDAREAVAYAAVKEQSQYSIIGMEEIYLSRTKDDSVEDSTTGNSEELLWRDMVFSSFICGQSKQGIPGGAGSKDSACNSGDPDSIPGSGRSPGEGNSDPLQYSCLENSVDRGAWRARVHGVTKSQTQLSD